MDAAFAVAIAITFVVTVDITTVINILTGAGGFVTRIVVLVGGGRGVVWAWGWCRIATGEVCISQIRGFRVFGTLGRNVGHGL